MSQKGSLEKGLIDASTRQYAAQLELLTLKGNSIAKKEGYNSLNGIEAIQYYLIKKHNWLPSQVRSMSMDNLSFCMSEE